MDIMGKTKRKYARYRARHQNILDAAIHIFNEKGYKGATIAEISAKANVDEPIIYRHFRDKKDLYLKCFGSISNELLSAYRKVYRKHRHDEIAYLEGCTKVWVNYVVSNPHKIMFLVHMLSYRSDADFGAAFDRFMTMCVEGIKRELQRAQAKGRLRSKLDPDFLAMAYVNQHFTAISMRELRGPEYLAEDKVIQLMQSLLGIE